MNAVRAVPRVAHVLVKALLGLEVGRFGGHPSEQGVRGQRKDRSDWVGRSLSGLLKFLDKYSTLLDNDMTVHLCHRSIPAIYLVMVG